MTHLHLNPTVVVVADDEGYLAYDVGTGRLWHLNPSAALVLELVEEGCDLDQIHMALAPILGADGWPSCRTWIESSVRDGLFAGEPSPTTGEVGAPDRLRALASELRGRDRVLGAYICQRRATELAPDDPQIWYELGELAHIVGRRVVARNAYERYFDHHPDDAEVEHLLVSLRDETPPARVPDRCIRQLYSRFSSFYEENMRDELGYRAPELLRDAIAAAAGNRRGLAVLDLGCGTGLSGELLRPRAGRMVGVDLSPEMIERAERRGLYDALHEAEIGSFLASPSCGSFDLVVACDALIYFGDLGPVLRLARQRLEPEGLVAFTVERSDVGPFRLTDSGRFAHHRDHLFDAADAAGLVVESADEAILRQEYGSPVPGLVVVCRAGPDKSS
jgi:predicted TPR repeat methyltransferase